MSKHSSCPVERGEEVKVKEVGGAKVSSLSLRCSRQSCDWLDTISHAIGGYILCVVFSV